MVTEGPDSFPRRKYPAKGIHIPRGKPVIVFITVCTEKRLPWLANEETHAIVRHIWKKADAWHVGRYVLMPDHVHLFAGLNDLGIPLEQWIRYWKTAVSRRVDDPTKRWQKGFWDRRLRSLESYTEKWEYVRDNPVRKGQARDADSWSYQGEVFDLQWWVTRTFACTRTNGPRWRRRRVRS